MDPRGRGRRRRIAKSAGDGADPAGLAPGAIMDWLTSSRLRPRSPRLQPRPRQRAAMRPGRRCSCETNRRGERRRLGDRSSARACGPTPEPGPTTGPVARHRADQALPSQAALGAHRLRSSRSRTRRHRCGRSALGGSPGGSRGRRPALVPVPQVRLVAASHPAYCGAKPFPSGARTRSTCRYEADRSGTVTCYASSQPTG